MQRHLFPSAQAEEKRNDNQIKKGFSPKKKMWLKPKNDEKFICSPS
jgi:hypothetical protein